MKQVHLPELVGSGFGSFWRSKARYRVVKGSRASKKTKTTALNLVCRMMAMPGSNALVLRRVYRTLRNSCYQEIVWAVRRLGAERRWRFRESPLEAVYLPTGQRIYFRGLDDASKIAGITAQTGALCWVWIEEAYELSRESDFDLVDESVRGKLDGGLFKQITLTFNPWNGSHWLRDRFYGSVGSEVGGEKPDFNGKALEWGADDAGMTVSQGNQIHCDGENGVFAMTARYFCNEWLDAEDRLLFARMRRDAPRRYLVAGLGEWGVGSGLIYENWEPRVFTPEQLPRGAAMVVGLDFGYSCDPTAVFCGYADMEDLTLYVWDELYEHKLSNRMIAGRLKQKGWDGARIRADSSEPKSIAELRECGIFNVTAARKGADSVLHGIQFIQGLKLIVHPRCRNFLREIGGYAWLSDAAGNAVNRPAVGVSDHLMDAMRYAMEGLNGGGRTFEF